MSVPDIAMITHLLTDRPRGHEQLIVAGGDEDVCSDSLREWVAPLLAGIPSGRWTTCQIDISHAPEIFARFRSGSIGDSEIHLIAEWSNEDVQAVMRQIPSADALMVVVLDQYSSS